jgi:hypothetical protein
MEETILQEAASHDTTSWPLSWILCLSGFVHFGASAGEPPVDLITVDENALVERFLREGRRVTIGLVAGLCGSARRLLVRQSNRFSTRGVAK